MRRPKRVVEEDPEDSADEDIAAAAPLRTPGRDLAEETKGDVSESELSSLIDESPVKKKRQKKSPSSKVAKSKSKEPRAVKPKPKPSKPKGGQDDDPDQAEIKRLQGWLVKCGIRKVWSKELAKFGTSKDKIKHLKAMLKDAGMDGKYSVEKAARIKEERELAKDLEAIQEGERQWGKIDDAGNGRRPLRRAARGATNRVIRDPEDGEEGNLNGISPGRDESDTVDENGGKDVEDSSDNDDEEDSE